MTHFLNINTPTGAITPDAVVLIDPATGNAYAAGGGLTDAQLRASPVSVAANPTTDSTGAGFNPDACTHAYGYDASGNLATDTATSGTSTWVKTYSYAAGKLTGETVWMKE